MLGNSWVAAQLAASPEGLSSMKLVGLQCVKFLHGETRRSQQNGWLEVLVEVRVKITVFWDMTPCSLVESIHRFWLTYCLQLRGKSRGWKSRSPPVTGSYLQNLKTSHGGPPLISKAWYTYSDVFQHSTWEIGAPVHVEVKAIPVLN
jgi:hypothetical protein